MHHCPRQRVTWKVRVWPGDQWSEPATWEMGFLKSDDWTAQWIEAGRMARGPAPGKILRATYETLDGKTGKDVTPLVKDGVKVSNETFDVTGFSIPDGPVTRWITEPKGPARYEMHRDIQLTGKRFECTLPANSIQTFEVKW